MPENVTSLVPKKPWANPEEVDRLLSEINEIAAKKGFLSIVVVGELADGDVYTAGTRTEDKFKLAGAMMFWAMRLMGLKS